MAFNNPYMMASALRNVQRPQPTYPQGGGTVGNGMGGLGAMGTGGGYQQPQNQQRDNSSPISPQTANNMMKYFQNLKYGGGATQAAGSAAMPAMSAGGGSSLGSMGLQQGAVNFPGAAAAGGGGGGTVGGGGFMSNLFGGGGGAAGGAGGGAASSAGGLGALAALAYLGDKEMNESEGSWINADKLNNAGTIGGSGIGLRFGDFANGFNPATWLSDPKKAAKGLGNAFTFGFLDKIM